ncbi:hypothetical protein KSB_11250 [Ktedonobacter robiniae]|uniref:Uncharacterized protein n=1 Tax=Ktedonobacter robiniae TaxID=2778365 RepID=A0ABQ3UJ10_9CHLR|nr:hypothetical protein KSB_11250 [Ktedonobacter robiniae]
MVLTVLSMRWPQEPQKVACGGRTALQLLQRTVVGCFWSDGVCVTLMFLYYAFLL